MIFCGRSAACRHSTHISSTTARIYIEHFIEDPFGELGFIERVRSWWRRRVSAVG
jgi:hypothetical protein